MVVGSCHTEFPISVLELLWQVDGPWHDPLLRQAVPAVGQIFRSSMSGANTLLGLSEAKDLNADRIGLYPVHLQHRKDMKTLL